MKKAFLVVLIFVFTLVLSGCGKKQTVNEVIENNTVNVECQELCENASGICPSLIIKNQCEASCGKWNDETRDKIKNANNCEELSSIEEVVDSLVPEINEPELDSAQNDCESACTNYVNKCLTLVPNATQALFQEGLESCVKDCAKWNGTKIDCMIQALDCPSMTEVCGL
jgi:hypothetical protein